jgi:hypothetical protein
MLRAWINLLPLFIVKRIARKRGEIFVVGSVMYSQATDGVLVRTLP